jgi:hypothetical protein
MEKIAQGSSEEDGSPSLDEQTSMGTLPVPLPPPPASLNGFVTQAAALEWECLAVMSSQNDERSALGGNGGGSSSGGGENGESLSLLAVRLLTGRRHQIRAQLSHAGLPIFGDDLYGRSSSGGSGSSSGSSSSQRWSFSTTTRNNNNGGEEARSSVGDDESRHERRGKGGISSGGSGGGDGGSAIALHAALLALPHPLSYSKPNLVLHAPLPAAWREAFGQRLCDMAEQYVASLVAREKKEQQRKES